MKYILFAFNFIVFIKFILSCGILTNLGDMFPDELNILANSDIVFNCTLNPERNYTTSNVIFSFHDRIIDQKYVQIFDKYTAQLRIKNASPKDSGRYYCKIRNGERKPLVCVSEAKVGYKPNDLPIKDFSCIYQYRREMKCSWTKPENKLDTSYVLSEVKHAISGFNYNCGQLEEAFNKVICVWNKSTVPRANYHAKYHYVLRAENSFGQYDMPFSFNLSSIVQLDPPQNLSFSNESNVLSWEYPNLVDKDTNLFHLLKFKIMINKIDDNSTQFIYLGYTEQNVKLQLKPYTWYNFSISCKVNDPLNDNWSKFSSFISRTKEDVPESPPIIINQAFEATSITPRSATIYWKTLADHSRNGPDVLYLVTFFNHETKKQTNITTRQTKYIFDNLDSKPYEFRIYSKNLMGLSKEYSKIILPTTNDVLRAPNKITVYVHSNLYELHWENSTLEALQNYTVFWCVAKNDFCTSDINWNFVTQNYYALNLSNENYKFGVSANTQKSSSGISWTKCIVNGKSKVDKLHAWALKQGSSSILLKWNFLCDAQKKLVRDLRIQYCPKDSCQDENVKMEVVPHLNSELYLVKNLIANTTYKLTISSSNIAEENNIYETTDLGTPLSPTDLEIIDSNNYSSLIRWNFSSDMLEYFKIEANFLQENVNISKESCELPPSCLYKLTYKPHLLKSYFDYDINIFSCNINGHCSNPTSVSFKTPASKPGKMFIPKIDKLDTSKYRIFFEHPRDPNGPIDYYYVVHSKQKLPERFNGSQDFADLNVACESNSQVQVFEVSVFASNIVNEEELKGDASDSAHIDLCNKEIPKLPAPLFFIIIIIVAIVLLIFIIYCAYGSVNNIKAKKKEFQINVMCNKDNLDPNEKDNLVQNDDEDVKSEIVQRPEIVASETNASITSDSSSPENSHSSSDKNLSSDNNCYSDSNTNYNELNYRENREYFINTLDESSKPLMSDSGLEEKPSKFLDMGNGTELNKSFNYVSPSSSQFVQKPATNTYVPLSPIANSNSQYVPHSFVASQSMKNSTNV